MIFNEEDIKLINAGAVDSRAKGSAGHPIETHPTLPLQRTYCLYCGKGAGYVSMDSYKYIAASNIITVCDACVLSLGEPPLQKADIEEVQ